jgi:hypothetical protein
LVICALSSNNKVSCIFSPLCAMTYLRMSAVIHLLHKERASMIMLKYQEDLPVRTKVANNPRMRGWGCVLLLTRHTNKPLTKSMQGSSSPNRNERMCADFCPQKCCRPVELRLVPSYSWFALGQIRRLKVSLSIFIRINTTRRLFWRTNGSITASI